MSVQQEADLILKLYDLRREEEMRKARDWYFREFNPDTFADFQAALFGPHSGHLRMVVTYWDMAAAMVNRGAISMEFFNDTNGEQMGVFMKIEPMLAEIRATLNPRFAANLEKLVDATPDGRKQVAEFRERFKQIRAVLAKQQQGATANA
jgi:hypothetical protein